MKNILIVLMGIVFVLSSSGYVMYKTSCSCTGEEQTMVFVRPNTCEEEFHKHHTHNENDCEVTCCEHDCHECHECNDHTKSCGCDSPEVFFFKLKDKAVDDEVKFVAVQPLEISISSSDILAELCIENDDFVKSYYADPPPKITSSLDFLIQIHQLKIPSLA